MNDASTNDTKTVIVKSTEKLKGPVILYKITQGLLKKSKGPSILLKHVDPIR